MGDFESKYKRIGEVTLPVFAGTRVMMLPVIIGDETSLPDMVGQWRATFTALSGMADPAHLGKVGYLTLDEKMVDPATAHRRAGMHVDGIYQGRSGGWGGGGGGWGSAGNGMLTVASHAGCRAWNQRFSGWPGYEGECDHLAAQIASPGELFEPGVVYWVDGMCVHESVPQPARVARQFVRLSMPSEAPWFDGYTRNPLGVEPTGEILPRRAFMDA